MLIADGASTSLRCYGVGGTAYGPRLGEKLGEFPAQSVCVFERFCFDHAKRSFQIRVNAARDPHI